MEFKNRIKNIVKKNLRFVLSKFNLDVWSKLKIFNPDIVITTGFNFTYLYAYIYAKFYRKKHIPMTDGWIESEKGLPFIHKLLRKLIFKLQMLLLEQVKTV